MTTLKSEDIKDARIFYEYIMLTDNNGKEYFVKMEDIVSILKKFDYTAETKRTRTWCKPIEPQE